MAVRTEQADLAFLWTVLPVRSNPVLVAEAAGWTPTESEKSIGQMVYVAETDEQAREVTIGWLETVTADPERKYETMGYTTSSCPGCGRFERYLHPHSYRSVAIQSICRNDVGCLPKIEHASLIFAAFLIGFLKLPDRSTPSPNAWSDEWIPRSVRGWQQRLSPRKSFIKTFLLDPTV